MTGLVFQFDHGWNIFIPLLKSLRKNSSGTIEGFLFEIDKVE